MRFFVGFLVFIFLAPICVIAGLFGSCMLAGVNSQNEGWAMTMMFLGPLIGFVGSIALTVLIVRSMRMSTQ